jgi:hypothetical protein
MSDEADAIVTAANAAVSDALTNGQSESMADMSKTRISAREALEVSQKRQEDVSRKAGRRPLFRGFNLGNM